MPAAAPQPSRLLVPRLSSRGFEPPPNPRLAQQSADGWGAPTIPRLRPPSCAWVGVAQSRQLLAAPRQSGARRVAVPLVRSEVHAHSLGALAPSITAANTATSRHRRPYDRGLSSRSAWPHGAHNTDSDAMRAALLPRACWRLPSRWPSEGPASARFAFGENQAAGRRLSCAPTARSFGSFDRSRDKGSPRCRQGRPPQKQFSGPPPRPAMPPPAPVLAWLPSRTRSARLRPARPHPPQPPAALLPPPSAEARPGSAPPENSFRVPSLTASRLSSAGLSVGILCRPHPARSKAAHQTKT